VHVSQVPPTPSRIRPVSSDPLLSMVETAAWLGCHVATVRRLIDAEKLKAIQLSPRRIGVRQSEIERYLAANEIGGFRPRSSASE